MDHMKQVTNWLNWLVSRERRRAERQNLPNLVAHYWDGAAPLAHKVRDISSTGLYLVTEQRWYPGTLVMMSLQRDGLAEHHPDRAITVKAKVVRSGVDGVGFVFAMLPKAPPNETPDAFPNGADRKTFERFLERARSNRGQALIEYALILPLLLLLVINVVNFGGFFFAWITVANASRAGADYAIMGGDTVGAPGLPTAAQVTSIITQDISSLPNSASLSVSICQNYNGTITTLSGTCTSMPSDPEPVGFPLTTVDVTYTYVPFLSLFQFPNLGIYSTIPPTTIHRRAVMRVM